MRDPALVRSRRLSIVLLVLTAGITIVLTLHDGAIPSRWTNALGGLLGCLAGTYVGEHLERFGERTSATGIAWIQMALIALFFVGLISWQALPPYCQIPVAFAMGVVLIAATVYIQRLRMRLG